MRLLLQRPPASTSSLRSARIWRPLTRHSPDVTIGPRRVDDIRAVVLLLCDPLSIVSRVQDTNRVDSLDRGSTMNDHPERSFTADARPTSSRMGRLRDSTGHDCLGTALDSQQQRSRRRHMPTGTSRKWAIRACPPGRCCSTSARGVWSGSHLMVRGQMTKRSRDRDRGDRSTDPGGFRRSGDASNEAPTPVADRAPRRRRTLCQVGPTSHPPESGGQTRYSSSPDSA